MFLHSGASLHGHEYSSSRQQPHQQNHPAGLPFLRSALRRPSDPNARRTVAPVAAATATSPSERPVSYHEHVSVTPRTVRPRPTSDYMPRRELSVRFREPETDDELPVGESPQSEDESSLAYQSDASDMSDGSSSTRRKRRMRRKRAPRQSTQFLLAQPVPRIRPKQRKLTNPRPRLLLQLQDLTEKRPLPAFDVVPSSLAVGSLLMPRLAKKCPSLFRAKPMLGLNDLLIVRSEDYETPASPGSDFDDCLDQRDVIAIVSPLPHMGDDACEVVMEDGSTWESSLMANGSYEFIGVDERGRISTARWVRKAASASSATFSSPLRTATGTSTPPSSPAPPEFKWTFSMIHPDTRRHPIMGSLQSNALDVFDTFTTMSPSSGRYPPTRPQTAVDANGSPDWHATNGNRVEGRITKAVPEDIKLLMVVTAAWIHLRQDGWQALACTRPPPATLQRRNPSNALPQKGQTFPILTSLSSINPPQPTPSPSPSLRELSLYETPGRRRSLSSSGFVKRFVAPRASEDGARRPTVENIYLEAEKTMEKTADRPQGRRMSVRQIANRIFRRKSVSQAQ
ncbi:hypothetical protein BGZ63DRAFT_322704, partial [Mariannaea sp. PMI_226]